jgi:hypothetical protein
MTGLMPLAPVGRHDGGGTDHRGALRRALERFLLVEVLRNPLFSAENRRFDAVKGLSTLTHRRNVS